MYTQFHHPRQTQYVLVHTLHLEPSCSGKSHIFWVLVQPLHQFPPIQAVRKRHFPNTACCQPSFSVQRDSSNITVMGKKLSHYQNTRGSKHTARYLTFSSFCVYNFCFFFISFVMTFGLTINDHSIILIVSNKSKVVRTSTIMLRCSFRNT